MRTYPHSVLAALALYLTLLPALINAQDPSSTPADPSAIPNGWRTASTECIGETQFSQARALAGANTASDDMTIAKCIAFCDAGDFVLAGLQYARECFCGPFLSANASLDPVDRCVMPCAGDPSGNSICGGPNALSLFISESPRAQRLSADYKYATLFVPPGTEDEGCFLDDADDRILGAESITGSMTLEKCLAYCSTFGFAYAGLTGGNSCFCDIERRFEYAPSNQCNRICSGDNMVTCGGTLSTRIYHTPGLSPFDPGANSYSYRGCYYDPPAYALTDAQFVSDSMTVEICTNFCAQGRYRYSSLGFGRECRCGNEFQNGAGLDRPSNQCTIPCAGDVGSNCGGRYAIAVYEMEYEDSQPPGVSRRSIGRSVVRGPGRWRVREF